MKHLVYILRSDKLDRYYIGYTSDLETRLEFHLNAEAHKFTAKANDWQIIFTLECDSKTQALLIEKHIKKMKSTKYIQNLLSFPEISQKLLSKYQSDC